MSDENTLEINMAVMTERVVAMSTQFNKLETAIVKLTETIGEHNKLVDCRLVDLEKVMPSVHETKKKVDAIEPKINVLLAIPAVLAGAWSLIQVFIYLSDKLK